MLTRLPMMYKLLVILLPATIIVLAGVILSARDTVRTAATDDAVMTAKLMARAEGERIVQGLLRELRSVEGLASVAKTRDRLPSEGRRAYFNRMLLLYLEDRPDLLGVWMAWEPDTFDGLDDRFVNTEGHDATGRFIPYFFRNEGQIKLESLREYETPGTGDYYLLARRTGQPVILEPYRYEIDGVDELMTSIVAPIIEDGRFVGAVGVDLLVSDLQRQVAEIRLHDGVSALFGHTGTVIAHPDETRLGADVRETESDVLGEDLGRFADAIEQGESVSIHRRTGFFGGQSLIIAEPVSLGDAGRHWSIAMALPMESVLGRVNAMVDRILLVGLVGVLVLIVLILVLSKGMSTPLRAVVSALQNIASGEGDLTQRLPVKGRDEIALLATAFNGFVQKIQDLVREVRGATSQLASAAQQLSVTSEGTKEQVQRQQSEADQVATAMNEMTATVQEVARHASGAARAARDANEETGEGGRVVKATIAVIESLAREVEEAAAVIHRLETDSDEIGKVLDVIRGIAEQINLLALNAAIEAARAGEQGRGFAVVADEVRNLASRTQASTKEIQEMIERLQNGANAAVAVMEQGRARSSETVAQATQAGQSLTTIADAIAHINDMNTQIASAAEQQSSVAEEIDRNMANIAQSVDSTANSSTQVASASDSLSRLAAELQSRIGVFKA